MVMKNKAFSRERKFLGDEGLMAIEWSIDTPMWEDEDESPRHSVWINCEITDGESRIYLSREEEIEALITSLEVLLMEAARAEEEIAS